MVKKSKKIKSEIEKKFEEFQEAFVNKLVFLTSNYGDIWQQEWFEYELALDEDGWEIIANLTFNPPEGWAYSDGTFGCTYIVKLGDVVADAEFLAEQLSWEMMWAYDIDMDKFVDEGWL